MLVSVNMSREVYEYFKAYNFDELVNCLLEEYDFTSLPQMEPIERGNKVERRVNVTDPVYIDLYNAVGPRSKKVSLGRLLKFAYDMDVLSNINFKVKPTENKGNPAPSLVDKAYKALLEARRYDKDNIELRQVCDLVYELREVYYNGIKNNA